ncbi:hypothetical protein MHM_00240 [Candidatus Mycoplasma haemominutum 'Birmingham 1']|uniref:Uncharacterized protein n=1 Tax=Candidatus Mycoplasma haematominutum 'Birmingham 1' TaxID=1116213 RepID=G8C2J4_9MOLU|nr:hypothetical protein MHM_00240 [Candidatus Mycoplasma haematominutum 'Birmingham 1']
MLEVELLDNLWKKWNTLKKERITKKIKDKTTVLNYVQSKSALEIEKWKIFAKRLKAVARGKKSDEIYRELRMIPEFKSLKNAEIRTLLWQLESELKNASPEEIEKSLLKLQEMTEHTLSEIEEGFHKIKWLPQILNQMQ